MSPLRNRVLIGHDRAPARSFGGMDVGENRITLGFITGDQRSTQPIVQKVGV